MCKWKTKFFNNVTYKYSIWPWCPLIPLWGACKNSVRLLVLSRYKPKMMPKKSRIIITKILLPLSAVKFIAKTSYERSLPWNAPCKHWAPECLPSLPSDPVVPELWQQADADFMNTYLRCSLWFLLMLHLQENQVCHFVLVVLLSLNLHESHCSHQHQVSLLAPLVLGGPAEPISG